jgi:ABC-type multidrug transport system ATPase subunit
MPALISLESVSKTFPGVRALNAVRFELESGEVHALRIRSGSASAPSIRQSSETLPKVIDTGFYWYDKTNMTDPKIAAVLYD